MKLLEKMMNKKEYLKQGYKIRQEIKIQQDVLLELESNLDDMKAISYDKDKLQGGPLQDDSKIIDKIDDIIVVEEIIKAKNDELKRLQAKLFIEIDQMKDTDEKTLLKARYILNEKWEQIADRLYCSVRQVHRVHRRALENFVIM